MTKRFDIEEIMPILRCPSCQDDGTLEIEESTYDFNISVPLYHKAIFCKQCSEQYPITADLIPIMWTDSLRQAFLEFNRTDKANDAHRVVSANMQIYNDISDDYAKYTRQDSVIGARVRNAVKRIFPDTKTERLFHLDYACGPGHLLSWLKPLGFRQIGLDVSLANLRNARKRTGCTVICGDASIMPFANNTFDLVTESAGLHHILNWESAIAESCRICKESGGLILDSEPSDLTMAWSKLAVLVFNARFPVYKVLSYVYKKKYMFRDTRKAKLNMQAEIHHQPGKGIPLDDLRNIAECCEFKIDIIVSPTVELNSKANLHWKGFVLRLLSGRNPWNPKYGYFTAIATSKKKSAQ